MNIAGVEINLKYKALEIYIAGCKGYCEGCQNPELWDFNIPSIDNITDIINTAKQAGLINAIWVLGGEPLDHPDLSDLLKTLDAEVILLWTHFQLDEVPIEIRNLVTHIKTGPYIKGKQSYIEPIFGIELANPEQRLYNVRGCTKEGCGKN